MNIFIEWLSEKNESYNELIEKSILASLKVMKVDLDLEISVTIVDDDEIQVINLEQRGIDKPTDVLSFPMIDFEGYGDITEALSNEPVNPESGEVYLGDIVISWEKVLEQSEEYGHTVARELSFLTVHSMLHLLGFDHMTEDEEADMKNYQKAIMTELGIER